MASKPSDTTVTEGSVPLAGSEQQQQDIPEDIFSLILEQVQYDPHAMKLAEYRATLAKLSLVCRFFLLECQPRLFRSLVFTVELRAKASKRARHPRLVWIDALEAGEARAIYLASCVQSCHFTAGRDSHSYITIAIHFTNLRRVTFDRCHLDSAVLKRFAQLPNLRDVCLVDSILSTEDDDNVQGGRPDGPGSELRGKWTRLSVSRIFGDLSSFAMLGQFVDFEHIEHLSGDDHQLAVLLGSRAVPLLKSLTTRVRDDVAILSALLERMPNLTSLEVEYRSTLRMESLSPQLMPHLGTLVAPNTVIAYVAAGRPVRNITILPQYGSDLTSEDLRTTTMDAHALRTSTTPVEVLSVPAFEPLSALKSEDFPALHTVMLLPEAPLIPDTPFMQPFSPVNTIIFDLGENPFSRSAAIEGATKFVELPSTHVNNVAALFPNATRICAGHAAEWLRDASSKKWRLHVLSREILEKHLNRIQRM